MNVVLSKFFLTAVILVCISQICFAQTDGKLKSTGKLVAPTISVVRCNKTTENAEAEKFCNKGLDLTIQQKFDEAIAAFTKAIELVPKYADAYNRRGVAYNWKKDNDSAIADFTKAIELEPNRVELYLNRGSIYFIELQNYELAISDFTKAIELNPKNDFFYRMRARSYDAVGRKDLADADLQKARELRSAPKN